MSTEYTMKPLKAPRSAGTALKALSALAESGLGGALSKKFFKDIGITALRDAKIDAAPSAFHPLLLAGAQHAGQAGHPGEPPEDQPQLPLETAADFTRAYRDGTSPVDVAERVIAWTQASNAADPALRAVIAQNAAELRELAQASAKRWSAGVPLGPLDGVPIGVKDELDQRGYRTQVGTSFLGPQAAATDATVVARLRAAGALLIGKLNMHEVGLGVTGLNPHHGAARNPYNSAHASGGSSSGPAVAVAAGLCPIAIGADGGGSIRIPASLCGVLGLKSTFGRISEHGAAPLCWSVAHVGPIAASARDLALGYLAIAGPDSHDPNSLLQPPVAFDPNHFTDADLSGLKIGIFRPWYSDAEPGIVSACDTALDHLKACGATVKNIAIPDLELLRTAHMVTIVSEMVTGLSRHYAAHHQDYGYDTRLNLALSRHLTASDYVQAQRIRAHFDHLFAAILKDVDVIATPTTARTAPVLPKDALKTGESNLEVTDQIMRFAIPGNTTGLPAISIPVGYSEGLPVGIQFMGRAHDEAGLLRLAMILEGIVKRQTPVVHQCLLGRRTRPSSF